MVDTEKTNLENAHDICADRVVYTQKTINKAIQFSLNIWQRHMEMRF
jgi:hypothetical protein